ncbi:MAG TPA: hypothetical protein VJ583_11605 [Nitrososphaeraceae archaeon]|nr:hypothetical protein [Nitrososphaeraceae archaeon]
MDNNKYKYFLSNFFPILIGVFLLINTNYSINYISSIEDKQQNATLAFGDSDFIAIGEFHTNEGNIMVHLNNEA